LRGGEKHTDPSRRISLVLFALLVVSVFLLSQKLSKPSIVQIVIDGSSPHVVEAPKLYSLSDVLFIVLLSITAAACATYVLVRGKPLPNSQADRIPETRRTGPESERRARWEGVLANLKGAERAVYGYLVQSGGAALQAEIVTNTGLSKAAVSMALGRMQAKGFLEKRKAGMVNVVILK